MCLQSQHCLSEENLSLFVPAVSGVGHLLSAPQHGLIKNKDLSTKNMTDSHYMVKKEYYDKYLILCEIELYPLLRATKEMYKVERIFRYNIFPITFGFVENLLILWF